MIDLKSKLDELSDKKYKEFHMNLCPNVNNIIGVRIPKLRELAKEVAKELDKRGYGKQKRQRNDSLTKSPYGMMGGY